MKKYFEEAKYSAFRSKKDAFISGVEWKQVEIDRLKIQRNALVREIEIMQALILSKNSKVFENEKRNKM